MEDWLAPLQQGHPDAAWDRFLTRYRRLIFATIRHYTQDYDDGMDLFAHVCEKLHADGMRRLRVRAEDPRAPARFSTWLVVVVRHLVVDWYRHRDGRRRLSSLAEALPALGQRIVQLVFVERCSHAESYELLRSRGHPDLTYREFMTELRQACAAMRADRRGRILSELAAVPPAGEPEDDPPTLVEAAERRDRLHAGLARLTAGERAAVELYVMEGLSAERVAAVLGLANAKAVYNRVYRALAALREWLERAGIRRGDL